MKAKEINQRMRNLTTKQVDPAVQELLADVKARGKKQIYILKPDAGCQGRGIRLVQVRSSSDVCSFQQAHCGALMPYEPAYELLWGRWNPTMPSQTMQPKP